MLQERQYKREVAYKTGIGEILKGEFEPVDGSLSLISAGRTLKRVSVMATIVDKSPEEDNTPGFTIDDGTGQIRLRLFDDAGALHQKAGLGDFVLVIGRLRGFNNEKYIAPEIIKAVENLKWAEVRKLESRIAGVKNKGAVMAEKTQAAGETPEEGFVSREKVEVYRLVRELDAGPGAELAEVKARAGEGSDKTIAEMLSAGDIFEVLPGRLKVLE